MTEDGDGNGDADGLVSSPMLVGHIGTQEWDTVDPECVEGVDTIGGFRTLAQSTRNALVSATTSTSVVVRTSGSIWCGKRERMVHVVGVNYLGAVIRESLAEFHKGNSVDGPRDWGSNSSQSSRAMKLVFCGDLVVLRIRVEV